MMARLAEWQAAAGSPVGLVLRMGLTGRIHGHVQGHSPEHVFPVPLLRRGVGSRLGRRCKEGQLALANMMLAVLNVLYDPPGECWSRAAPSAAQQHIQSRMLLAAQRFLAEVPTWPAVAEI